MSNSKLQIEGSRQTCIVDEQEWISSWLRNADYNECNRDVIDAGHFGAVEPVTPPRRPPQILKYDEVSPTSTSFSHGSVFDVPKGCGNSWTEEDPFCDDVSDITSVGNQEDLELEAKIVQDSTKFVRADSANDLDTDSFASYDPPSGVDEPLTDSIDTTCKTPTDKAALPIDRNGPCITWITSCTQCILADLSCSRTTPCCSRCRRNGRANVCLLHRRKFREETERSNAEACTQPVLLKLQGEDETVWEEKLRLADELDALWHANEDRNNWVFPPIDSRRGYFRTHSERVSRTHPGEGKGHLTYRELYVAVEY